MIEGKTYKITKESGEVVTGKFIRERQFASGPGFVLDAVNGLGQPGSAIFFWDEIEAIERIEYVKKTIDKPLSKIGTPHG